MIGIGMLDLDGLIDSKTGAEPHRLFG